MKQKIGIIPGILGIVLLLLIITGFSGTGSSGRYQAFDTGNDAILGIIDTQTGEAKLFMAMGQNRYRICKASFGSETIEVSNIKTFRQLTSGHDELAPFMKPSE